MLYRRPATPADAAPSVLPRRVRFSTARQRSASSRTGSRSRRRRRRPGPASLVAASSKRWTRRRTARLNDMSIGCRRCAPVTHSITRVTAPYNDRLDDSKMQTPREQRSHDVEVVGGTRNGRAGDDRRRAARRATNTAATSGDNADATTATGTGASAGWTRTRRNRGRHRCRRRLLAEATSQTPRTCRATKTLPAPARLQDRAGPHRSAD